MMFFLYIIELANGDGEKKEGSGGGSGGGGDDEEDPEVKKPITFDIIDILYIFFSLVGHHYFHCYHLRNRMC